MKTRTILLMVLCCVCVNSQLIVAQSYFRTDGDARINNDSPTLNFTDTDDNLTKGQLKVNGDDFRMSNGSGSIDFYTGESNIINPRVKIAGRTGFVGIGTTNPSSLLTLSGETTDEVGGSHQLYIIEENSSTFGKIKFANKSVSDLDYWEIAANSTNVNEFQINFRDFGFVGQTPFFNIITVEGDSQQVGINTVNPTHDLSVNGSAGKPGGGNWSTFSDKRLKKEITGFTDGLEEVMKINTVTYKFNGKAGIKNIDKAYVGIIAQEMQKIAPYMIEELKLEDGSEEAYLSYDGSALIYMLVNAVQEQQVLIDEKTTKVKNLESRLDRLEEWVKNSSISPTFDLAISGNK